MVENTTFSGVGKTWDYIPNPSIVEFDLYDYKGRKVYRGEEYYAFNAGETVYVHIEDVIEYLNDERLNVECYDLLIQLIELYYDNYPVVM